MATPTLSNLATQATYKVYICDKDGAKGSSNGIIANLDNTTDIRRILLEHAISNRPLVYESTTYGYTDQNISSAASHYQYFLGDNNGVEGTVPSDALDITPYVTDGFKTALYPDANDITASASVDNISTGVYTYVRRGNLQVLRIDTESEATTDSLYKIAEANSQIADRDILIVVAKDPARVISVYDHTITTTDTNESNICVENATVFVTGSTATYGTTNYDKASLTLMWDANINLWIELNRTPKSVVTESSLRNSNVNIPIKGTTVRTITGSENIEIASGVDPGIQYFTGTVNISSSNYTVNKPYGSALEGDVYVVKWNANVTTTGTVTIFGMALTAGEASTGSTKPVEIVTRYANGAWTDGIVIVNSNYKEPALGNPSSDGMLLSSTAAGVRSWTTLGDSVVVRKFTYDFAISGGSVSTITPVLADIAGLPKGAIIDASRCIIQTETALTSSGSATLKVGINCSGTSGGHQATDDDFFLASTNYNAAPLAAVGDTKLGASNIGKLSDTATVTWTIGTAALTAGKVHLYVFYINAS